KAGLRQTVERGYWPGGPPPYGYRLKPSPDGKHTLLAIDEDQAAVLRLVRELIVDKGYSTVSAAEYLNVHGHRTVRGQPWRHPNLCFRLRQTHLTGTWVYQQGNSQTLVKIPAIFTDEEWNRLQS